MISNGETEEEARKEIMREIDSHRRELLRVVQQTKGSVVPRAFKEFFWKANSVYQIFYNGTDGFSSKEDMVGFINSVVHEPINLPPYST